MSIPGFAGATIGMTEADVLTEVGVINANPWAVGFVGLEWIDRPRSRTHPIEPFLINCSDASSVAYEIIHAESKMIEKV